jgi:hypothetical protein
VFPQGFAGVGIEADHAFAESDAFAYGCDDVCVVSENDRRRPPTDFGLPQDVGAFDGPVGDDGLFAGEAVLLGAAPLGPIGGPGERDGHGEQGDRRKGFWVLDFGFWIVGESRLLALRTPLGKGRNR